MAERRKHARRKAPHQDLEITFYDRPGEPRVVGANMVDTSANGLGIETNTPILEGTVVQIAGFLRNGSEATPAQGRARVARCLSLAGGTFHVGLSFDDVGARNPFYQEEQKTREKAPLSDLPEDYYEILQLSPSADLDMIHRAYRLLAQRYHPDNQDTGNEETFKLVHKAYDVLHHHDRRAAYDIQYTSIRKRRWKIFDQPQAAHGLEAEKRKRAGILSLLYTQRIHQPDHPSLNIKELEELLGIAREHLEFSLWYLRENAWITRSDNGRYAITAKGVDAAEASGIWQPPQRPLLTTSDTVEKAPGKGDVPDPHPVEDIAPVTA